MGSLLRPSMSTSVKKFIRDLESIDVIPPKDGESYVGANNTYHVGDGETVRISERQANLATILATDSKITEIKAAYKAGYTLQPATLKSYNGNTLTSTIKQNFRSKFRGAYTISVQKLQHHIQEDSCKAIGIDAAWVLGQQVALYEECHRKGMYTQAVRLLHDISYHVSVDARVSNKLEVTEKIDYAALLNNAEERTKSLPAADDTVAVEGKSNTNSTEILDAEFEVLPVEA